MRSRSGTPSHPSTTSTEWDAQSGWYQLRARAGCCAEDGTPEVWWRRASGGGAGEGPASPFAVTLRRGLLGVLPRPVVHLISGLNSPTCMLTGGPPPAGVDPRFQVARRARGPLPAESATKCWRGASIPWEPTDLLPGGWQGAAVPGLRGGNHADTSHFYRRCSRTPGSAWCADPPATGGPSGAASARGRQAGRTRPGTARAHRADPPDQHLQSSWRARLRSCPLPGMPCRTARSPGHRPRVTPLPGAAA